MKEQIIALIEHENPKNPLTDEEIAEKLGLNRKTVTMFRQEAGIPDSRERKKPVLMAKMRELIAEQPSISDRGLTRLLEDDGFAVGKYVVGKLAEDIRAELTGKSMDDAGAFSPSEYAGNTEYAANTDDRHLSGKEQNPSVFQNFIGYDGSLMNQISQAQAAILYPPKGLHCLLYGPSGVGKSYLAELMHSFACGTENFGENPPYFAFNCADYADSADSPWLPQSPSGGSPGGCPPPPASETSPCPSGKIKSPAPPAEVCVPRPETGYRRCTSPQRPSCLCRRP